MPLARWLLIAAVALSAGRMASIDAARADNGNCQVPHFTFNASGQTPVTMNVTSGNACRFYVFLPSSAIGTAGILSTEMTVKPKHGMVGKRAVRFVAYKPDDGFFGSDHFEMRVRYNRDDGQGDKETILSVEVTVR